MSTGKEQAVTRFPDAVDGICVVVQLEPVAGGEGEDSCRFRERDTRNSEKLKSSKKGGLKKQR